MRRQVIYIIMTIGTLLSNWDIYAQEISVDGKVLDAEKKIPIPNVSISALQKDSLLINFTVSDPDGNFKIKDITPATCFLSFSCIGYHTRVIPIRIFESGQTVMLSSQLFKIKEVIVQSHRIRQQGDTIVYQVSGFKMAQDRSIGDVLKKMPGLEVLQDGRIKFQGRAISKLYIEGSDLLESKYGLAVRNVRAQDVKSVEVMENHEAIKALKGIRFNEAAAINLTLKDDAKARWIGIGDVGAGTGHHPLLWNARMQGMKFEKNQQNFSIYKGNNTGMDVSNELHSLITDPFAISDQTYSTGLLSPLNASTPDINEAYYLQNNSHLLSFNQLWKKDNKRLWRFQASYVNSRIKENAEYLTGYFYGKDDFFTIQESNRTEGRTHHLDGELSFEQNSDSLYVKNVLSYKGGFDRYKAFIDNHPGNRSLHLRMPRQSVTNRFSLIRKSQSKVFQLYSFNQWIDRPQRLQNRPESTDTLFNMPYEQLKQRAGLSTFLSHTFTSFRFRMAGFYVGAETGIKLQSDNVDTDLERLIDQTNIQMSDSFRNKFSYFRSLAYLEPNVSYTGIQGRLSASLKLNAGWLYRKQSPDFVFQPQIHLNFKITPLWEASGNANRNYMEDDIRQLFPGYIMNGYRSFLSFNPKYTSRHSDTYTLSSTFKNPMKGVFLSLNGGFIRTEEEFVDQVRFDGIVCYTDKLPQRHIDRSKFIQMKAGQSFSFWNTRLSCSISYNDNNYLYLLSELSRYQAQQVRTIGNIVIQPFGFANIEYDIDFIFNKIKTEQDGNLQSIRETDQLLTINLYPSPNWLFRFSHSFYRNNQAETPNCYFMDLQALYRFGKEMEISLSAQNLLGKTQYSVKTIDSYYYSNQVYPLRGREICVNYSFSF